MSATIPQLPIDEVVDVQPGDQTAAITVQGWLQEYTTSRDPRLRERIILAYLSLGDRLANRYRNSSGTTLEDLTQTVRAGLIAAIDRYDPAKGPAFVPLRSPAWWATSNATCVVPAGGCTCRGN